mgnify:CR=1 FL=1
MNKKFIYQPGEIKEEELTPENAGLSSQSPYVQWLIIENMESEVFRSLVKQLHIHPLIEEDIKSAGQLPKVELLEDYTFLSHHDFRSAHPEQEIGRSQVSHILGERFLITFIDKHAEYLLQPVINRLKNSKALVRKKNADYLLYMIVDASVDHYLAILNEYREHIEELEDELTAARGYNPTEKIQDIRHNLQRMRKFGTPLKTISNLMRNAGSQFVQDENRIYWQDVNDNLVNVSTTLETLRELLRDLTELYQANLNTETNQVMKTLTVVATIFIPLTFIVGIYGMNFTYMPELNKPWGYPLLLVLMGIVAGLMLWYMRIKKWL